MLSFNSPTWFYPEPIDFRKQLDGLIIMVADHLQMSPTSGQLFLFRSRAANKIKMLWWDRNGFWMFYKRLEKGKFQFPTKNDQALELTRDQFNWLLSGLNCMEHKERVQNNFYNWHLHLDAILTCSSFRNVRNTIKYSFTFLQSEHINLAPI